MLLLLYVFEKINGFSMVAYSFMIPNQYRKTHFYINKEFLIIDIGKILGQKVDIDSKAKFGPSGAFDLQHDSWYVFLKILPHNRSWRYVFFRMKNKKKNKTVHHYVYMYIIIQSRANIQMYLYILYNIYCLIITILYYK